MGKERPTSKAPLPITPVGGTSWTPRKPQPIQFPTDLPPYYPVHLRDQTRLIMLDCAKQCRGQVEFCRCVVARLISLFIEDPEGTRPDLISPAVDELVRYILISNEHDADQRYRLHQQVWQSEEWAALVKAAAEKPVMSPSGHSALPVKAAKKRKRKRRRTQLPANPAPVSVPAQARPALFPVPAPASAPVSESALPTPRTGESVQG